MERIEHAELRKAVTGQIIAALERGFAPWQRPWVASPLPWMPMNAVTGRRYRGINFALLLARGFADPRWCTAKQAYRRRWQLVEGPVPATACFYARLHLFRDRTTGAPLPMPRCVTVLREYELFHVSQFVGVPPLQPTADESWDPCERAENLLRASGAAIVHGGDVACYAPTIDRIRLPQRGAFAKASDYYATALHELAHWTGHTSRLDRPWDRFGTPVYAREELRAEMASAMLSAQLGVPYDPSSHASYVGSWLRLLAQDHAEIFRAAADAQRICDLLAEFSTVDAKPAVVAALSFESVPRRAA
jgi:putative DNA primase/helicase